MREKQLIRWLFSRQEKIVSALIVTLVVAIGGFFSVSVISAQVAETLQTLPEGYVSRMAHDAIIRSYENQVSILKWVGVAVVTSLATAITFLFRELSKTNALAHSDLVSGIERREELLAQALKAMNEQTVAVSQLAEIIEEREKRKESES